MGTFTDPKFVKEFSYRTKINYYTMLKSYSEDPSEVLRAERMIECIHAKMIKEKYTISGYYEVTQLINSLIGLLVFPEQMYFKQLSDKECSLSKEFPTLYELIKSREFICSYKDDNPNNPDFNKCRQEKKAPRFIIAHLRNAVAHEHLMIWPLQGRMDDHEKSITAIVFEDACIYKWNREKNKWIKNFKDKHFQEYGGYTYTKYIPQNENDRVAVFHLEVPVDKLEPLLMEICDYFVK